MSDPSPSLPKWAGRQAAILLGMLETVVERVQQGEAADRVLHTLIANKKQYGSRDRRLFGDAVFTWFRLRGAVADLPLARGLCVAWHLDARPASPAISAILQDIGWPDRAPLAPGLPLAERKAATEAAFELTLPDITAWIPPWVAELSIAPGTAMDRVEELLERPPTWLRVDLNARENLHEALLADGAVWAGETSPEAYAFTEPGKVRAWLQQHGDALEVHDLASQQVARLCAPAPGESWWDACCGAGGKSLHLLDLSGRTLDLTCTDRRGHILKELTKRGRRHGLANTRRYELDLLEKPELPNIAFDGILLDAPCSGAGTWSRSPDALWRTSEADIRQHGRRQARMLETVSPALKPGGRLVYSVCSLTRPETLEVVDGFLASHPGFQLQATPHPLTGEPTDGRIVITPVQSKGDGMFVAVFRSTC